MKPWHYGLMSVLVALLLAAGGLLMRERAEKETWKGRALLAETNLNRQVAESKAREKDIREPQDQAIVLRQEVADLPAAKATRKARETSATASPATAADGKITADTVKEWLADAGDPAVLRRLNTQGRIQTLRHYASLLTELNLPADQTEALTKLLVDKQQTPMDLAASNLQQGTDPSSDVDGFRNQIITARAQIETQIHSLLGDANYAQYQDYDQNLGRANVINDLQTALLGTAEPLTGEQAARMTELLKANNVGRVTAPVVNRAREFLSPTQLQALQDLRAIQQANSQKRNQPGQILPTAKPPPGKKS